MVNGISWFVALFGLSLILAAFTRLQFKGAATIALYWLFSWLGQTFALQLGILSSLLAVANIATDGSSLQGMILLLDAWLFWRMHLMGHRTAKVINEVADEAITSLDGGLKETAVDSPSLRWAGFRPFHYGGGVECHKNIQYGDFPGRDNLLDIYQPINKPAAPMPILIQVPGGAWITGDKNQQALPLLHNMARQGWTCVSINYRLGPKHRFPAMLEDVFKAIAWVKEHAAEYGADADYVVLTGGSAGGHLISLAGLLCNRERFQQGFEQVDTHVNLVVPFYGRYDFLNLHNLLPGRGIEPFVTDKVMSAPLEENRELWELATPELQVHDNAPPFFIIHGSYDSLIPVEECQYFVQSLKAVSQSAVHYAELPLAEHAFDIFNTSWCAPTVAALTRYLVAHHSDYLSKK